MIWIICIPFFIWTWITGEAGWLPSFWTASAASSEAHIAQISLDASRVNASSHLLCLAAMQGSADIVRLGSELVAAWVYL